LVSEILLSLVADFYELVRTGFVLGFGEFVWLGGMVLPAEFLKLTNLQNKKFVSRVC
jgi:hypothetical protein